MPTTSGRCCSTAPRACISCWPSSGTHQRSRQGHEGGGHFVVYDAWRDLLIIGPGHGVLRVEPADKKEEAAARAFLLQHSSLVSPLRVCKLVVAARRASETAFNTPEHYTEADPPAKHVRA